MLDNTGAVEKRLVTVIRGGESLCHFEDGTRDHRAITWDFGSKVEHNKHCMWCTYLTKPVFLLPNCRVHIRC